MLRSDSFGFLTGNLNSLVYMLNPSIQGLGIWANVVTAGAPPPFFPTSQGVPELLFPSTSPLSGTESQGGTLLISQVDSDIENYSSLFSRDEVCKE